MWQYIIVDTETGVKQDINLLPASGSWNVRLNAGGSGSHTFMIRDSRQRRDWPALTKPWSRTLVVCWQEDGETGLGTPIYQGIINGRKYDKDAGTLEIRHADFRSLLARRTLFGENGFSALDNEIRIDYQPWTLYRMVLRLAFEGPTTGYTVNFAPGIVLDPASTPSDGDERFERWDYQFPKMLEMLDSIQNMMNGPDTHFTAQWDASMNLQWKLLWGEPWLLGPFREFFMDVQNPVLRGYSSDEDASKQANSITLGGEGSEADRPVAVTRVAPTGPALEWTGSANKETDITTLKSLSDAQYWRSLTPTKEVYVTASARLINPASLTPGQQIRLQFADDPFEDDTLELRLMGWSSNGGDDLPLVVQRSD